MGSINNFYISGGIAKIKVTDYSSLLMITYLVDFKVHFLNIDLPPITEAS